MHLARLINRQALLLALPLVQLASGALTSGKEDIPLEEAVAGMTIGTKKPSCSPGDPNSVANYEEFITRSLNFQWNVDFEHSKLSGTVLLTVERLTEATNDLLLDAKALQIEQVQSAADNHNLPHEYNPELNALGGVLRVTLPSAPLGTLHEIL